MKKSNMITTIKIITPKLNLTTFLISWTFFSPKGRNNCDRVGSSCGSLVVIWYSSIKSSKHPRGEFGFCILTTGEAYHFGTIWASYFASCIMEHYFVYSFHKLNNNLTLCFTMEIKLLDRKQYQERTGLKRTTLWRKIRKGEIIVLKVSPKKLWFLPPEFRIQQVS